MNTPLSLFSISTKHFFEFLENIPKTSTLALSKLILKTLKSCETLPEWILSLEWVLLLLITCHTSLIVYPTLTFVTKSFISIIDMSKPFFGLRRFVYVRMVLFCKFKISCFYFRLCCFPTNTQLTVQIIVSVASLGSSKFSLNEL